MNTNNQVKLYRVIDNAGRFYTSCNRFDSYIHYDGVKLPKHEAELLAKLYNANVIDI